MISLKAIFADRKKEIEIFLNLLELLDMEAEKLSLVAEISDLKKSFGENGLEYQSIFNIMKSNIVLMLYNIIEFTIAGLIQVVYDRIQYEQLCYRNVSEELKDLWRKHFLAGVRDPNATYSTFLKKNEDMITFIIEKKVLTLEAGKVFSGGNLDGETIKNTLMVHGINIYSSNPNFRPDKLRFVKNKRNELAHGEVSFSEALRDKTIGEISDYINCIFKLLEDIIVLFENYIDEEKYKNE